MRTISYIKNDPTNPVDLTQIGLITAVLVQSYPGKVAIDSGLLVTCIGVSWVQLVFATSNLNYSVAVFLTAFVAVCPNQSFTFILKFTSLIVCC